MSKDLLTKEEYSNYCSRFKYVWSYLCSVSYEENSIIEKICELRDYSLESNMPSMLKEIGFLYINPDEFQESKLKKVDADGALGLYTNEGNFLLKERFIFPVKDMLGNIIALIGWFPDEKKYITTPSKFFKKQNVLFGMEQLKSTGIGKTYFLVEGIFDSIAVRSLGFNCVALMGISANKYTEVLYTLYKKIIAIPDNDKEGRKVIFNDAWRLPSNGSYVRLKGEIKDIDDLIKYYEVKDTLKDVCNESERIIAINI